MNKTKFDKILALFGRVAEIFARLAAVLLAIMMFLTLGDVVGRAFSHPILGAVESIELMMGMLIYLGVGYTTFLKGHINVDFIIVNFTPRTRAILEIFTSAVGIIFITFVVWRIFDETYQRWSVNAFTHIWKVPYWPVALVMAIALTLMWIVMVLQWIQNMYRVVAGGPYEHETPPSTSAIA